MDLRRAIRRASARLFAYACATTFAAVVYAGNGDTHRTKVIRISGPISTQALTKLNLALNRFDNTDPIPAGLIVLLNSPGGDGEIAMQMGRLLRQHHAHIFVTQQCDSACVFLLMGGVVRAASPGTLGVHAGRLTVMTGDGNIVKEVDANRSLDHSFQLASYNRDTRLYLQEMGIDHRILDVMLAHRTPQVYQLNTEEMRQYQLTGFDNAYLNQRVQTLEAQQETRQINRVSLFSRTMSVPIRCASAVPSDRRFVDCYRETLLPK